MFTSYKMRLHLSIAKCFFLQENPALSCGGIIGGTPTTVPEIKLVINSNKAILWPVKQSDVVELL